MNTFPIKHPDEVFPISVDFSRLSPSLVSATVAISVQFGSDSNPSAMKLGLPQISGGKVSQMITGGVHGNIYVLKFTVSDGTSQWVHERLLPVSNEI